MWIAEYRLGKQADTTHYREQYIKYIIGSGQHTNSHIYDENGYLYQAPITFYTQRAFGTWLGFRVVLIRASTALSEWSA
ncbi:MAG: hypothetical protein IPL33_09550 [Sphingobacteriales bacterium]|nr:hypothetical protein [Sphingobacteriales bacterium]